MTKKATKTINEEATILTFNFADEGVEDLVADIGQMSEGILQKLAMHGFSAKLGDSYAGSENAAEARSCAERVLEELAAGNWTTRVAGVSGPRVTQLAEALVRVATARGKTLTLEKAVEALAAMPDAQKTALRSAGEIKKALAEIKIERLEKEVQETVPVEGETSLDALFG
jgi:hypothetical protein